MPEKSDHCKTLKNDGKSNKKQKKLNKNEKINISFVIHETIIVMWCCHTDFFCLIPLLTYIESFNSSLNEKSWKQNFPLFNSYYFWLVIFQHIFLFFVFMFGSKTASTAHHSYFTMDKFEIVWKTRGELCSLLSILRVCSQSFSLFISA